MGAAIKLPAMRFSELGDLRVSVVGLGASKFGGQLDLAATREVVDAAVEAGVNFVDTADVYGGNGESERLLGEALRGRRAEMVVATKFGMLWGDGEPRAAPGSRPQIRRAVEGSLRRLQTDWIDVYQYHLPDGVTPIEETLSALDELVQEGKVRHIGCCNFSGAQLAEAARTASSRGLTPFVSLQNEYNLLERTIELEVLPACRRLGVGVIPYFPLASGLLTGKYRRGEPGPPLAPPGRRGGPEDVETHDRLDALARFASARGLAPAQVAIGALAAQPVVTTVIAGATSADQVRANAKAADWTPQPQDLVELDQIFPPPAREPAAGGVRRWRRLRRFLVFAHPLRQGGPG